MTEHDPPLPAPPSNKLRRILQAAAAAGVMVLVALVVYGLVKETADQRATTVALCALRDDLKVRVKAGNDFLAKHPRGIPGIPAATIRTSIDGQRRTIRALHPVKCG